jgi:hypothetical protein
MDGNTVYSSIVAIFIVISVISFFTDHNSRVKIPILLLSTALNIVTLGASLIVGNGMEFAWFTVLITRIVLLFFYHRASN